MPCAACRRTCSTCARVLPLTSFHATSESTSIRSASRWHATERLRIANISPPPDCVSYDATSAPRSDHATASSLHAATTQPATSRASACCVQPRRTNPRAVRSRATPPSSISAVLTARRPAETPRLIEEGLCRGAPRPPASALPHLHRPGRAQFASDLWREILAWRISLPDQRQPKRSDLLDD